MGRARRFRTAHPGVYLKERRLPGGGMAIRARYDDPDAGKTVYETLDLGLLPTRELRRSWAIEKARALAERRRQIERGSPLRRKTPLAGAIEGFLRPRAPGLKPSPITLSRYGIGLRAFEAWARTRKIAHVEDITPDDLGAFRRFMFEGGRRRPVPHGDRGERAFDPAGTRSPSTINSDLKSLKIALMSMRAEGLTPLLSKDEIGDRLKNQRVELAPPEFLNPAQLHQLIGACQRHDAAMFKLTRDEHARGLPGGTTPRYAPITPYLLFLLLSGCRRGEPLALEWTHVDLDAREPHGRVVGEIRVPRGITKTGRARTIGLEVSPALRRLLDGIRPDHGTGPLFPDYTAETIERARTRLVKNHSAPAFTWQGLRSTCATYLTCSTGIWGSATVFLSARQLGHSVAVAEKHYLNVIRGIPVEARTLEAAMQCEALIEEVLGLVPEAAGARPTRAQTDAVTSEADRALPRSATV